jgi:hypothetical protein
MTYFHQALIVLASLNGGEYSYVNPIELSVTKVELEVIRGGWRQANIMTNYPTRWSLEIVTY